MHLFKLHLAINYHKLAVRYIWKWEDISGRPAQVELVISIADAIDEVNALLPQYKTHSFINDQQSSYFKSIIFHKGMQFCRWIFQLSVKMKFRVPTGITAR